MKNERPSEELNRRNAAFDNRLRPEQFADFVGQRKIRDRLELAVEAAKDRGETLDHVRTICEMILGRKMTKYFDKQILFREVSDGEKLELAGFQIQAFDIGSKKMKQFGFQLNLPEGGQVCFAGDEPVKPCTEKYAQGAKWLFSEAYCLYADRELYKPYERSHVTSLDAAELAQRMGAENLVIYHTEDYGPDRKEKMTQEAKTVYGGNVFVPEDMETVVL